MIKYRPQRGTLADSMAAVQAFASEADLMKHVRAEYGPGDVTMTPYGVDDRIGWDTWLVSWEGQAVGFTDAGPRQDVEARFAAIRSELNEIITHEVKPTVTAKASKRTRVIRLQLLADRAMQVIQAQAPCKKGCAHCCRMAVTISKTEADIIGNAIKRAPAVVAPLVMDNGDVVREMRDADVSKYTGVPCVFLKDSICTIYEVRPLACRVHHSLESTADPCDTSTGVHTVARANMQNVLMGAAYIEQDFNFADIREFFPEPGKASK